MLLLRSRIIQILTKSLTVVVSTIAIGVAISTIVAIAIGERNILRSSNCAGQQSQEGKNKK
jgi:ABC-type spermidine/putrescine transport system permease subunit II